MVNSTLFLNNNIMLLTLFYLGRWAIRQRGVMQHNANTSIILLQVTPGFVYDSHGTVVISYVYIAL